MAAYPILIRETTTTTGNGLTVALSAVAGRKRFSSESVGTEVPYVIELEDGSDWEHGLGTVRAGNTFDRTTPRETKSLGLGSTRLTLPAGAHSVYSAPGTDDLVFQNLASVVSALGYTPIDGSSLNASNLDSGTVPAARLPAIAITEYLGSVADEAAMLALIGEQGDWCTRTDNGKVYVITGADPTQIGDWTALTYPGAATNPGGSDTQVQFNDGGSAFGGDSDFTFNKSTNTLYLGGPALFGQSSPDTTIDWYFGGRVSGPDTLATRFQDYYEFTTPQNGPYVEWGDFNIARLTVANVNPSIDDPDFNVYVGQAMRAYVPAANTKNIYQLRGGISHAQFSGSGSCLSLVGHTAEAAAVSPTNSVYGQSVIASAWANSGTVYGQFDSFYVAAGVAVTTAYGIQNQGQVTAGGTVTNAYQNYNRALCVGGATNWYSYYTVDLAGVATNSYYFWADSRGVYRIREDAVADGAGNPQAVTALYNPRFTKYTAGTANYERVVQQWVGNVATIGTEAGGTGTLRALNLIGSAVQVNGSALGSAAFTASSAYDASGAASTAVATHAALTSGVHGLGTASQLASDTDGTLAANSDSRIATQKAVKTYVDGAVTGLLDFKGSTDASGSPNYPSASKGDAYYISVAGKIGGASGKSVEIGDVYVASADNAGGTEASVGTSWFVLEHNLVGAVISGGALGTPSSGNLANCTSLPLSTGVTGTLQAAQFPALTGDVTTSAGALGTTLATVNSNIGSFTNANITVNAKGLITAAASGSSGSGTVTATGGSLTSNAVVLGAGTTDTKVVAGISTDGTSAVNLGVAGSSVGKVVFANATSGTGTLQPPTGALGTITYTLPGVTATLATLGANVFTGEQTFNSTTIAGLRLNNLTTTQRDALTPSTGMAIWNTTNSRAEVYNGSAWDGSVLTAQVPGSVYIS